MTAMKLMIMARLASPVSTWLEHKFQIGDLQNIPPLARVCDSLLLRARRKLLQRVAPDAARSS
eukprot:CAMPEP_0173223602 /NCGR_PEP_ID=MMETSP1142-20121109/3878_1 /TAXON_ID=483371 /ORGANISM="non described non described, Strain CCMP2298" /LENGTH=62 /DNA_ID=CAMNT_0014151783 /DNA_START=1445 /DNA_END=1629 /DNA_ORIENTATION=-